MVYLWGGVLLATAGGNATGRVAQLLQPEGVPVSLHPRGDQRFMCLLQLSLGLLLQYAMTRHITPRCIETCDHSSLTL